MTWLYVDSVYSKIQQEPLQAGGTVCVQKYECRLRKSRKPSTARNAVIARRRSLSGGIAVYHVQATLDTLTSVRAEGIVNINRHRLWEL